MGINDGLGFEEVNQTEGFTPLAYATTFSGTNIVGVNISGTTVFGTNVYGGTAVSGTTVKATNILVGATGSVNATLATSTTFSGTNIVGANISGTTVTNTNGALKSTKVNSAFGGQIYCGSNVTSAGSSVWVSYPAAYTVVPRIFLTNTKTEGALYVSGTPTTGSFFVASETAQDTFNWLSIGI